MRHPFKRAMAMAVKIGAILEKHGQDYAGRQAALAALGPYESRGKGKGRGRYGCRPSLYVRPGNGGIPQNNNPQSRECMRRVRQAERRAA